jgi:replication initiation protein RepC
MVLVVFASNATLCDRANGMDERALRRHLSRLSDAGLIRRKQSATGKRFPLKRDGMIRDAFGIDLTPLLERHAELADRAEEARREAEELRALRAQALALRAEALETAAPHDEEARSFLEQVKTVLRRATLTAELVHDLIRTITRMLTSKAPDPKEAPCPALPEPGQTPGSATPPAQEAPDAPQLTAPDEAPSHPRAMPTKCPPETGSRSAGDGRNVRHQDPSQINLKKRTRASGLAALWQRCELVEMAFPDPPQTDSELLKVIYDFGQLTRFDERILAEGVRHLGPHRLLEVLDYIGRNGASIRCRYSYLSKIILRQGDDPDRAALPV